MWTKLKDFGDRIADKLQNHFSHIFSAYTHLQNFKRFEIQSRLLHYNIIIFVDEVFLKYY